MANTTFSKFAPTSVFPPAGSNGLALLSSGTGSQWGVVPIASGGTGQTTAQAAINALTTGDLNLSGSGARITGDFNNATVSNRTLFQTKTAGQGSQVGIAPNGTVAAGTLASGITLEDTTSFSGTGSFFSISNAQATEMRITSAARSGGTIRPIATYLGESRKVTELSLDGSNSSNNIATLFGAGTNGGAIQRYRVTSADDHYVEIAVTRAAASTTVCRLGAGPNNATAALVDGIYGFRSHTFQTPGGVNQLTIGSAGQLGLGSGNSRGTNGQVMISTGDTTAASWSSNLPTALTTVTQTAATNNTTIATTAFVHSAIQIAGRNSQGTKTLSTAAPTGTGNAGDMWYQY